MWIEPIERFNGMDPGKAYEVDDTDGKVWIDGGWAKKADKGLIEAAKAALEPEEPEEKDEEGPPKDKAEKSAPKKK